MKETEEYRKRMYEKWCSYGPKGDTAPPDDVPLEEQKCRKELAAKMLKAIDDFYKKHPVE